MSCSIIIEIANINLIVDFDFIKIIKFSMLMGTRAVSEWIVIDQKMNQNQPQSSSSEGRADDDSALSDFLASLVDYTPTVSSLVTILFSNLISLASIHILIACFLIYCFRYLMSWWSITWPRVAFNVLM